MFFFDYDEQQWQETVDDPDWFELLSPFVSVKNLYIADRLGLILSTAEKNHWGKSHRSITCIAKSLHSGPLAT
jgi:hypothetical protein